jgi:hypothetical protein
MTKRVFTHTRRKVKGWPYGIWMLALAYLFIFIGLIFGKDSSAIRFLSDSFVIPGDATIYTLFLFYLTSSAARAFKIKDLESLLLTICVFFVVLKQTPLGQILFPWASPIGFWLTDYLAMAANRVFLISIALGGIVLAIRLLLGKEMAMIGLIRRKEEQ